MSRRARLRTFIAIALSVLGAVHGYLWLRLVSDPSLPGPVQGTLTAVLVVLFLSILATFSVARGHAVGARRFVALAGYVWLGTAFLLLAVLASIDVVRLVGAVVERIVSEVPPDDPGRRVAAARLFAALTAIGGGGAALAALRSGLAPVVVKEVRVRLERLPRELNGTTIVQLTDVHVGPTIRRDFVDDLVRRVNALAPDLVAITGDLVDGPVSHLADAVAPIGELESRYGTYFVTGNHEFYSGSDAWCQKLGELGVRVLRNERVSIGNGKASFDLAGVEDHDGGRFGKPSDVARAVEGRDASRELVLLAHQPRSARAAAEHGVGLQLSGHTHGGQIWPWRYLVYLQQPVVSGLGRIGRTLVYVSCGTGYWGPPMRLGAPAEITRITLESA